MVFKCIIFIILFAFAENFPKENPLPDNDITQELNRIIFDLIRPVEWGFIYDAMNNSTQDIFLSTENEVRFPSGIHLYNVTLRLHPSPSLKLRLISFDENVTASCEMASLSLIGWLKNTNYYIATEPILFNFSFKALGNINEPVAMDYHNFDQRDIKLLTNGYQYKPNEENEIKRDFETYLKTTLIKVNEKEWKLSMYMMGFAFFSVTLLPENPAKPDPYYFLDAILSTDYTLTNVTITGLWNFRSFTLDFSNVTAFSVIQIGDVSGTMVQNFPSGVEKSLELSLNADNFYISTNLKTRSVNVETEGYSVRNTESNMLLTNDQSKSIVERIGSAIGALIRTSNKERAF